MFCLFIMLFIPRCKFGLLDSDATTWQGDKGSRVGDDMTSLQQTQPEMCEMMNDGDSWSSKQSGGVQCLLVPKLAGGGVGRPQYK